MEDKIRNKVGIKTILWTDRSEGSAPGRYPFPFSRRGSLGCPAPHIEHCGSGIFQFEKPRSIIVIYRSLPTFDGSNAVRWYDHFLRQFRN